jgi:hypothetical protein
MAQEYERLATEKPPAPEPVERPTRDIQEAPDPPTRDIQEAPDPPTWAELKRRG